MRQSANRAARPLGALLPAVLLALFFVQGGAGKAAADRVPELSLSTDGRNFGSGLGGPILIGIERYVPGDRNQRTVWVRNDSGDPAWLWSGYWTTSGDPVLLPFLTVSASYGSGTAPAEIGLLPGVGQCRTLLPAQKIAAGETVPMVIGAAFDPAAPNETRLSSAEFAVNIGLTQDIGQPAGPDGCTGSGNPGTGAESARDATGQLPETGAGGMIPWLSLAAATMVAGFGFVAATRKRRIRETFDGGTEERR